MAKRKRIISSRAYIDALDVAKSTRSIGEVIHDFQDRHNYLASSVQERSYLRSVQNALMQLRKHGEVEPYESDNARSDIKMYLAETKEDEHEIEHWEHELEKEDRQDKGEFASARFD